MEIKLTQGKVALVDREDFDELSKYKWYARIGRKTFYAKRNLCRKTNSKGNNFQEALSMHRYIMKPQVGMMVDHIDGNGLNNTRKNLRLCNHSQNAMNKGKLSNNMSGYKGVTFFKKGGTWQASIRVNSKLIYLGRFLKPEEAYKAYCEACVKYHGDFANLG